VTFNTQSGSQWDGLRHAIHKEADALYNGFKKSEIDGPGAGDALGIDSEFTLLQYSLLISEFSLFTGSVPPVSS
jgi:hypothetical protein